MPNELSQKNSVAALVFVAITIFIAGIFVWYMNESTLKRTALEKAKIVTAQILADRAIYTGQIVHKLESEGMGASQSSDQKQGFIMLPAQMVRAVSKYIEEDPELNYRYSLISEWNINPKQGVNDPFDIWAWKQLRRQEADFKVQGIAPGERGYPWKPLYRFEKKDGKRILRYMRADPASAASCVACHNAWEKDNTVVEDRKRAGQEVGKQWVLHELMGALTVDMPIEGT